MTLEVQEKLQNESSKYSLPEDFAGYSKNRYLQYALAVVKGRALPDVRDGQKPVQRRILFVMNELGLTHTSKHVKSARVVGETLGKYHPHGDSSVYDAMVRMAQPFSLRYPLVDGQGNFGTRDGDSPAAMRYTEARLSKFAQLLLSELKHNTVDFKATYDGVHQEPTILPARLPFDLLNGSSGIAVGMATEIPPHNLTEIGTLAVELTRNPEMSDEEFYTQVVGPDFPGGGQIISKRQEILAAYKSGRGTITVRSVHEFEEMARGQWKLVFTQLPPGVSSAKILEQIEALSNPQPKPNKKQIDAEQQQIKTLFLNLIDTVRDEAGKEADVRLVIEPKNSKVKREDLVNTLLAYTSLESNFSMNLVAIGLDGNPKQKSFRQLLQEWVEFRVQTVQRRIENRVEQVKNRIHILDGRMLAFLSIDKVIEVIRNSDDPKTDLMAKLGLTEIQAEDILEIRLRQLARLEGIKIEKELAELHEELAKLLDILASNKNLRKFVSKEMAQDVKEFSDGRRTKVEESSKTSTSEAAVVSEPITVFLSKKGWIKQRSGHQIDPTTVGFKDGDQLLKSLEMNSDQVLAALSSDGRCFNIQCVSIPGGRTDGVPVASLADLANKTKIVDICPISDSNYLIACDSGYGFVVNAQQFQTRAKAGKALFNVKEGESLMPLIPALKSLLVFRSTEDKLLAIQTSEVKEANAGRGLQLMSLSGNFRLKAIFTVDAVEELNLVYSHRKKEQETPLAIEVGKRATKGKVPAIKADSYELITKTS